ncbi:response regulator [bacterium]|nr:response regulator [bacterium]
MSKILIVDDDADFVEAVRALLESNGYDVISAHSREDGMQSVKANAPDLMILDVMMDSPDDGFTMAYDIRKQGFNKPILMLSSVSKVTGMTFDKDSDLVPVDVFEEKPIRPERLLSQIKKLLSA